ncbi:MAG: DUF1566 domain-containing protein [Nitrospirae bacterium]|nr:DUF1566 domain-containing protein [Nitrospirota bacterium]
MISSLTLCLLAGSSPAAEKKQEKSKIEVLKVTEEAAPSGEKKKAASEAKRFIDNNDGTVLDKNTSLIWLKDGNIAKSGMPLQTARQFILDMNSGKRPNMSFTNWRLPTLEEIGMLIDKTSIYPALPPVNPFQNVQNDFYWTSSGNTDLVENAWIVDMASGVSLLDIVSYCNFKYVWPVRSSSTSRVKAGKVLSVGLNDHGQLGSGTADEEREIFQPVSGLNDVTKVVAGDEHAVAIKADGSIWAWGRNAEGQLGDGTNEDRIVPVMVKGLWDVVDVAAGIYHTVALRTDGTVWAWGRNYYGQLGDGTIEDRRNPVQIKMLTDVVRVFTGMYHTFALKKDGTVWAWGWNNYGQLGDGTSIDSRTPVQIEKLTNVAEISAGIHHSVALKKDGSVWAWGWNNFGLLGEETKEDGKTPIQVKGLAGIVEISSGMYHTVALKSDGTVWAWGKNEFGQLGTSTTAKGSTAKMVEGIGGLQHVAAGMNHTAALKSDNTIWVWGQDMKGKKEKSSPVQKREIKGNFLSLSSGKFFTLVLTSEEAK